MAKLEKPELSPEGIVYTRRVENTERDVIDAAIKAALNPERVYVDDSSTDADGNNIPGVGFDVADEDEHAVNLWAWELDAALDNLQEIMERMPPTRDEDCELLWQLYERADTIGNEIRSQWYVHHESVKIEELMDKVRERMAADAWRESMAQEAEGKR